MFTSSFNYYYYYFFTCNKWEWGDLFFNIGLLVIIDDGGWHSLPKFIGHKCITQCCEVGGPISRPPQDWACVQL